MADTDGVGGRVQALDDRGAPVGPAREVADLAAAVGEAGADGPRWVWAATDEVYPRLLERGGIRPGRCHDATLTERLLLGAEGRYGEPCSLGAAWARLHGRPVPADTPAPAATGATGGEQGGLFEPDRRHLPPGTDPLRALVEVHAEQLRRLADRDSGFRLLCAAESAGALAAAEMGHDGLPWHADVHDAVLTGLLGPRPASGLPPKRLAELAAAVQDAFGGRPVNPDSPAQLVRAFAEQGISLPSLRLHHLRGLDHPAAPLVVRYRELARIHTAHGWAWQQQWVRRGRFHPEYAVGAVVSGRWGSRGGGALQIPRILRGAVRADEGWRLVVADAGQLEPRVLAAMSGDPGLARAARRGDLYAGLAAEAFQGDRPRAKIALLAAMYGQTSGIAGPAVAVLRQRYPRAMELVETAARTGEAGGDVRSRLGRVSPPASAQWRDRTSEEEGGGAARARGRFTRNFVIQATAAEWAEVLLALLRRRLRTLEGPQLVFFQHDEVLVHAPREHAPAVAEMIGHSAADAGRLVFGRTPVRFPMSVHSVECYGDAK